MSLRQSSRARLPLLLLALAGGASGQELEPRAYAPNPNGASFVLVAYGKSTGDVLLDTSLPIKDVTADLNAGTLLLGRTFGFAGRSASFGVGVPYAWGSMEGNVGEEFRRITRSGLGERAVREGTVERRRGQTPYTHTGDWPVTVASALVLAGAWLWPLTKRVDRSVP